MSGNIYASDEERVQDVEVWSKGLAPRMSLWSVPEKWGGAFFILLVAQGGTLIGLQGWRTVVLETVREPIDTVLAIALVAAPLLVVAGIVSMIELEVALTLSAWYERRSRMKDIERFEAGKKEGLEEGREEGLDEGFEKGVERGRRLERAKIERELGLGSRVRRYPY